MQTSHTQLPDSSDRAPATASSSSDSDRSISFGSLCVFPASRLLLRDGREVAIGGRAFDLLVTLLLARGKIVEKNEIAKNVWPSTTVDDCNIRYQVRSLRKVLGPEGELIKSIPGRGYMLADSGPGSETPKHASDDALTGCLRFPEWLRSGVDSQVQSEAAQYVAIVDDDATILDAMKGLISSVGLRAEAFLSIRAMLNSTQSSPPGCIILDAWLPDKGGLDFHAELVGAGIRLPIIFISGYADVPMSVRAIKAGASDFLTKPVRHEDLLSAVRLAMATTAKAFHPA